MNGITTRPTYIVLLCAAPEVCATHVARHTHTHIHTYSNTDKETKTRHTHCRPNKNNRFTLKIITKKVALLKMWSEC